MVICTIAKVLVYDTSLNASLRLFSSCDNGHISESHPVVDNGLFIAVPTPMRALVLLP